MKTIFIFILTISFSIKLCACPQIPDSIICNGTKYGLLTYPLESYFKKYPDKRPKTKGFCTGLGRNYVATFEIIDNQLFLKDIAVMLYDSKPSESGHSYKSVINENFPQEEKIKMDSFTGLLEIAYGNLVNYGPICFSCMTYENYMIFELKKHRITYKLDAVIKETIVEHTTKILTE